MVLLPGYPIPACYSGHESIDPEEPIMAIVTCTRCKNQTAGLGARAVPGETGRTILANVCAACWKEWLAMQVKYINEYRLSPLDPKHFEFLIEQARALPDASGSRRVAARAGDAAADDDRARRAAGGRARRDSAATASTRS